jgi:signal transduction histidine kinase
VAACDAERRRIERDLHDGAQARLVWLGLALKLIEKRSAVQGIPEVEALVREAQAEVEMAIAELRELARGIHPKVLTDEGLESALRSLAERSPVPVAVSWRPDRRLPRALETCAYFVCSEALVNVAKHARATQAGIEVACENGALSFEIRDDGIGGAMLDDHGGLRGLADRVEALGGELEVRSPPEQGTVVSARVPCVLHLREEPSGNRLSAVLAAAR